ncbi:hypothetical protein [Streptomyces sp. WMMC940]|uniref:hypothetical protein n=1 Tax=Streptomyces sp. WMMC940 TaxID=3015153 RepID=UPI0022B6E146|nr:hypothetical protein [Streptomyces sp. WMMC940]MCZ7456234.1 hypothetical protein [Streptomyces sp. WMMC940]
MGEPLIGHTRSVRAVAVTESPGRHPPGAGDRGDARGPGRARPHAAQELAGLIAEEWGKRYSRPVRLGKNPTHPRARINTTGADRTCC